MKRILCALLAAAMLIICSVPALADVPAISENLFKYAKNALSCLAAGDYERVVTKLPFSDVSPSGSEWRNLAEGAFTSLSGSNPQTKYAVAYWAGNAWKVAVPVSEPSSDGVEVLVLVSADGSTFTGYGCSSWGRVRSEYQSSSYVFWNDEYHGSTSVIIENDE